MKYKIGITSYDNDHELFETHVGNDAGELLYSCWAKTELESYYAARLLLALLNNFMVKA